MSLSEPSSAAVAVDPAGPQPVPANRRSRVRLRELCDEVLASVRIAHDRELISDGEREDARAVLARVTPGRRN
jgi:hypothetical protein